MNLDFIGSISSIIGLLLSIISLLLVSKILIKVNKINIHDYSQNFTQNTKGRNNKQNITNK